jgi:hypothetical protein
MTFLLGALLLLGSSIATGTSMLATHVTPTWLGLLFVLLFPLTIAFAFVGAAGAALPIASLSSVGLLVPVDRSLGLGNTA